MSTEFAAMPKLRGVGVDEERFPYLFNVDAGKLHESISRPFSSEFVGTGNCDDFVGLSNERFVED